MRAVISILLFAASTLAACSSGSDEDTSGADADALADSSSETQSSDAKHDGDAGATDTHATDAPPGDSTLGDSASGGDTSGGDTTATDSASGTDTTWTPDGDCDLPPAPIVDCSHATPEAIKCGGPPPDFGPTTYDIGCTAIVPEASGTSCGPLHCTCTDLGAAGAGWECG